LSRTRLVIGVTGNIGAGKTTVSKLFETWGAVLLEGDKIGHEALALEKEAVVRAFGSEILDENGEIDRKALGRRVFASDEALKRYHAIIREPMREIMERRILEFREGILVFDAALLFELGLEGHMDHTILVRCSRETLLKRALATKGYRKETVERILASQWPQERKAELADTVVENDGTPEELKRTARDVWEMFTGLRPGSS
jgi:dephospho-CoA kinase